MLLISVFTLFDETNPAFLNPLGRPNPRLIGNGQNQRDLIFRIVLSNTDATTYIASGVFKASFGGKPSVEWPRDVNIQAGGSIVLQGLSASVGGGIGVLDALAVPDGPADLDVCWMVDGKELARCICPLVVTGQDLASGGAEHPFVAGGGVVVDSTTAISAEIVKNDAELAVLPVEIKSRQTRLAALTARNTALKAVPAVVVVLLMLLAFPCFAAEKSLFDQGQVSVETFAGGATADFKHFTGLYGVGVQYAFHQNWSVGARVLHSGFDVDGVLVEDVQGRITGRLPLSVYTKLAPYMYIGAGYRTGWHNEKGRDSFHLDTGAGLEYRFVKHLSAFVEAGWSANIAGRNAYTSASGIRWTF